jgi:hypothetical protein
MVEALTAAATAGVAMKYVLPAIRDLGEKVLEASEDSVSNAVVGFGKRLLLVLLGRRAQADQSTPEVVALRKGIERRVLAVARDPAQQKAASQLEAAIEDLLMADSSVLASIAALLEGRLRRPCGRGTGQVTSVVTIPERSSLATATP